MNSTLPQFLSIIFFYIVEEFNLCLLTKIVISCLQTKLCVCVC